MTTTLAAGFHLRTSITVAGATGSVGWNWASGDSDLDLTLTGNVTLSIPANVRSGCVGRLIVRGSGTVSFAAGYGMPVIQARAEPAYLLFRATATGVERVSITSIAAPVSRAFAQTVTHGQNVSHGLGSLTGLTQAGYYLELRAYDSAGNFVTGITATNTSADAATVSFTDTSASFSGTLIFTATPY